MLQQLQIKNFKGWKDTGPIRMAPLTLFFGANSSGKSSIGQFLMMLKQTAESADRKAVFFSGTKNTAVQLGSYQDMVFQRTPTNKVAFEYRWKLDHNLQILDILTGKTFSGDTINFKATVGVSESNPSPAVEMFSYQVQADQQNVLTIGMERKLGGKPEYDVNATEYDLKRNQGRVWYPSSTVRFYGFPDEVVAYYQNADFVQELNLVHEQLFRSISYLGPLRTKADRLYSWAGIEPESVGYTGENTIAAVVAARKRKIRVKGSSKPFEAVIAEKLKNMSLIDDFKVQAISKDRQEYEVKVRAKGSKDLVDLPDVGFGISQVLPVLVQCFYAPPGSIILMEQPEIHLHPNAQSLLADVFIDVINARENGHDRNIQLIIETHSEHFLRRLQRRIAENKITEDKVSAYFANVSSTPAKLESLQLDEYGNIKNWPEHFFGDEMGDITEQSKAALIKRRNQSNAQPGGPNE